MYMVSEVLCYVHEVHACLGTRCCTLCVTRVWTLCMHFVRHHARVVPYYVSNLTQDPCKCHNTLVQHAILGHMRDTFGIQVTLSLWDSKLHMYVHALCAPSCTRAWGICVLSHRRPMYVGYLTHVVMQHDIKCDIQMFRVFCHLCFWRASCTTREDTCLSCTLGVLQVMFWHSNSYRLVLTL